MPPELTFRPLTAWPGALLDDDQRDDARWSSGTTYLATKQRLVYEAERLGALEVVVQLAVREDDILRSGAGLKRGRKPTHPGVLAVLTLPGGQTQSLHCDRYGDRAWVRTNGWQDNLRAIAMTLEALRAVERWGAAHGAQYTGFRSLPSGLEPAAFATAEEAARFLATHGAPYLVDGGGWMDLTSPAYADKRDSVFRDAAKRLHPDRGGDPELWNRLQAAMDLLRAQDKVGA